MQIIQTPTPPQLLRYLDSEFHADDSKYTLEELRYFIPLCKNMAKIELALVKMTYVYPKEESGDLILFQKVATRINNLLARFGFTADPALEFYIIPLDSPRSFPKNGEMFGVNHINGAFTYRKNRKIFIFRREEWPKVAIHEACHHLPIHTEVWDPQSLMRIYDAFNIDKDGCPYNCTTNIIPNEAIIEYWAEIVHLKCISKEYNIPFKMLLEKETKHALCKAAKILRYQKQHFPLWKEDTHSFSYVVLRAVILYYHGKFQKIKYPYDSRQLTDFIINHFNNRQFQRDLLACKIQHNNNMRMTVFGDL